MNCLDVANVPASFHAATPKWLVALHDWNDSNHSNESINLLF